jgi:hypothetical protein
MATEILDDERVVRRTYPTASFTLPKSQIEWIASQASQRRSGKSEIVRDLIAAAMSADADTTTETERAA